MPMTVEAEPADAENHDEGFITALEDRGVLDLVSSTSQNQYISIEMKSIVMTMMSRETEGVADFLLEEEHGNDEHHGEEEDHDGELGALRKRSVTLFLRGHGDETGLHAGLEDRVLFQGRRPGRRR